MNIKLDPTTLRWCAKELRLMCHHADAIDDNEVPIYDLEVVS